MSEPPIRVLVVEDDEEDYMITRDLLSEAEEQRFTVVRADRLQAGLSLLGTGGFDVVLLDLSLPDSRGWETFHRTHARAPRVPVILLTGLADEALGVKAVKEGAQDYLIKGRIDTSQLVRAIRYAIERKKTEEQLERYAQEVREKNRQLEEDLTMAREVQQALLPTGYPSFPPDGSADESALAFWHLYRPSAMVGGDFFNVLAVSETVAGVFICDVMGHGMRAALVTAILRGLLEELRSKGHNPGEFLRAINNGMMGILRPANELIFASAAYLAMDVTTGVLRYASAGHPRPLHVRHASHAAAPLAFVPDGIGPALGIREGFPYPTSECRLGVNDAVILFTDGLYEAGGARGMEYGEERLVADAGRHARLPVRDLLGVLVQTAEEHAGDKGFEDDVCILGMQVRRLISDGEKARA